MPSCRGLALNYGPQMAFQPRNRKERQKANVTGRSGFWSLNEMAAVGLGFNFSFGMGFRPL